MRFRRLRLAFSAVCGMLCLLLLVLCVRSYWRVDKLERQDWQVCLFNGRLSAQLGLGWGDDNKELQWTLSAPSEEAPVYYSDGVFGFSVRPPYYYSMPIWFAALMAVVLAAAPWAKQVASGIIQTIKNVPHRFSLRTLLIATSVVAVGLGLAVYAASN
jgi:hypothetical protein